MWKRIKTRTVAIWTRFKAWIFGLLVAVGLVSAPLLQAIETTFVYAPATQYSDSTPMPLTEITSTNLYCNGTQVASELGADGDFNPDLTPGTYDCHATHVDIYGRESIPSNVIQRTVLPGLPNPPVLSN